MTMKSNERVESNAESNAKKTERETCDKGGKRKPAKHQMKLHFRVSGVTEGEAREIVIQTP